MRRHAEGEHVGENGHASFDVAESPQLFRAAVLPGRNLQISAGLGPRNRRKTALIARTYTTRHEKCWGTTDMIWSACSRDQLSKLLQGRLALDAPCGQFYHLDGYIPRSVHTGEPEGYETRASWQMVRCYGAYCHAPSSISRLGTLGHRCTRPMGTRNGVHAQPRNRCDR